jgi:hypothetical protein
VVVRKSQKPKELPDYPIAPDGSDDATVILTGMSIANTDYAMLSEASRRPYSRFPVHWEDGFATLLPQLAKLKSIQQWTDLRVRARLAKGDVDGAFEDAKFALRFSDAAREEPLLISQLVRVAQQSIAARSVSHGILSHQWTDAQLKEFQEFFGSWDPIRSFAHAFEGERAMGLSMMDQWVSHPSELRNQIDGLGIGESSESEIPNSFLIASVSHLRFPGIGGLIRQNQATLASYYSLLIRSGLSLSKEGEKGGYLPALEAMNKAADETLQTLSSGPNPYNALTRLLAPAVSKAMNKAVRSEQSARLTVTACALERFHRQHGSYPESLSELVPTFVPEPPVDLMDRKPLRYRRNPDGTFTLWSIGLNGVDDGGILHNKTHAEGEALDWVWPN